MRKFLLSALVLVIFIVYALHTNLDAEGASSVAVKAPSVIGTPLSSSSAPIATLGPTPVPSRVPSSPPTVAPVATPQGRYKNGTYTGSVADAFYGNIQVQVTISGGQITDVQFLQYPSDRRTSIEINSQAMPLLRQEAIQAQSAQVAGVSGATASSQAFIQSLGSALSQAS